MSDRAKDRDTKYSGHLIRAQSDDITKTCTSNEEGKIKTGFKRVGRPRLEWYDIVMDAAVRKFYRDGVAQQSWNLYIRREEAIGVVIGSRRNNHLVKSKAPASRKGLRPELPVDGQGRR